ncbi:magnesium transporter CorA family protein [Paenibacillus allorhizosphaerae]|uniref:Magnesium transport protein CorA n=1 Tax=Paenibacillus allorhizosphaerae TaxID=2849866 RepID=A0ABN7TQY9_9BACL|nr:magnesium transporter CorA family protein [Paenibacillus allorhizosphaerae]CAG7652059.1 Magnesium transport protein CorA [Paenibacillus allorhizosphaerae]
MTIRQTVMPGGWTWHRWHDLKPMEREELRIDHPYFVRSMHQDRFRSAQIPCIRSRERDAGALYGSLPYCDLPGDSKDEDSWLFFFMDERNLFTSDLCFSRLDGIEEHELMNYLEQCDTPVEGGFALLSKLALVCMNGLDIFAEKLIQLERKMRESNNSRLLDTLMQWQYDLIHWRRRIVPLEELLIAAKEAFAPERLEINSYYRLTALRVERLKLRLKRFDEEVGTMLAMDENIASYRGNEIMKTLTVFTVVCTPATVIAGLWGMNFEAMPGLGRPWGYSALILIICLLTTIVYLWLRWKGWTGDLIRGKKKRSNIV